HCGETNILFGEIHIGLLMDGSGLSALFLFPDLACFLPAVFWIIPLLTYIFPVATIGALLMGSGKVDGAKRVDLGSQSITRVSSSPRLSTPSPRLRSISDPRGRGERIRKTVFRVPSARDTLPERVASQVLPASVGNALPESHQKTMVHTYSKSSADTTVNMRELVHLGEYAPQADKVSVWILAHEGKGCRPPPGVSSGKVCIEVDEVNKEEKALLTLFVFKRNHPHLASPIDGEEKMEEWVTEAGV
ncbi:hypothetical protein ACFL6Y_12085, partial [Elusimicrobiota bacterium]